MIQVELKEKTLKQILKNDAVVVRVNGNKYYHLPFWFKKLDDGNYELHPLDKPVPRELEDWMKEQREKKPAKIKKRKNPLDEKDMEK